MNKISLTILLLFIISICFAQNYRFENLKQNIEKKIESNLWDDVLFMATDLIIEDFSKGDGYYYTALAFYKLGDKNNANKYIAKVKPVADASLLLKIKILEQSMLSVEEAKLTMKSAIDYELSNNKKAAADAWYQAWQYDKGRIEYAINAVSHYIDLKEYEKALEILNFPEIHQDNMAKVLIGKINNEPKMVTLNGYNNSIKVADKNLEAKSYEQAKSSYEEALKYKPSDQYAKFKITEVTEEIEWEKAINSKYYGDTEKYADKYPRGKYIDRANDVLKQNYISMAQKGYIEKNESLMKEVQSKYLKRFPSDIGIRKIRNLLLYHYYTEGLNKYSNKEWFGAKDNFQAYLNIRNIGEAAYKCSKLVKKCDWKINQKSSSFLIYTYDLQSPIGLSFGDLSINHLDYYINLKMNSQIFTEFDATYKIDNLGNSDIINPEGWTLVPTEEIKHGNIFLSSGLTFKILYPLWGYFGLGVSYFPQYDELNEYTDFGHFYQTYWMKNTDETSFGFFPEGGIKLKIFNSLVLKYGIVYREGLVHQFGFGFQ